MWIFKAQKRFFSTGVEKKGGKMSFLEVTGRVGQALQFIEQTFFGHFLLVRKLSKKLF